MKKPENQEERSHASQELSELGEMSEITSEKLEIAVQQLEERLQAQPKDKSLKKAVRALRKDLLPRLHRYETHQGILGNRNSYSKTDKNATFMLVFLVLQKPHIFFFCGNMLDLVLCLRNRYRDRFSVDYKFKIAG
ncbi:hypothetical protein OB236_06595 [Paenibacillus sp. WQ 127069]|uniref:Uncharacterized protein n=1 Tax=Paenibacillus baimaensis TaxID=2982185 RepID=A0ABT2UAX2_9BACL|nr:hypothetical protein [Paenibacillus sp. WQ 127069]MCU6791798.1 hypothetical protein [Paenibacillus sp. WQ 127069]